MPVQPAERGPLLADLAARHGAPEELTARQDPAHGSLEELQTAIGASLAAAGPVQYLVDVSEHQGAVNWLAVASSGVAAVIIKAREGTTYADPRFAANLVGARNAEIPVIGAYHFLTATSSAVTQADAFCAVAAPDLLHALDVEAPGPLDVRGWVDRYREHHPSKTLLIYSGKYLWSQRARVAYGGAGFGPLWVAGAVPGGYVPGVDETVIRSYARVGNQMGGVPFWGWSDWALMQYSESCRVPGISTRVDANAFRGTLDQLKSLTGQEADMPLDANDKAYLEQLIKGVVAGIPTATAQAVHGQQLYRTTRPDGKPYTVADALLEIATPEGIAKAIASHLQTLPAGTAILDDAAIAKLASAVWDVGATRLVR